MLGFSDDVNEEYVVYVADGTMDGAAAISMPAASIAFGVLGKTSLWNRAASDLDGDGHDDLLTRTAGYWEGPASLHLFPGPLSGTFEIDDAVVEISNNSGDSAFGLQADASQDYDGDGYLDLLVVDPWDDSVYRGRVYLVPGPLTDSGLVKELAVATVESELSGSQFGWDMVGDQDMDGDGELDLMVGAYDENASGSGNGAIYLFYGPMAGARSTDDADARLTHSGCIRTDRSDCHTGQTMKGMGDVNADGYDDVSVFIGWNTDDAPMNHIVFGAPR